MTDWQEQALIVAAVFIAATALALNAIVNGT